MDMTKFPQVTVHKQVYQTSDYTLFKFYTANRDISEAHITVLRKNVAKIGKLLQPVIVDPSFVVIDGQHRVKLSMLLKIPVFFIIESHVSLNDAVIAINTSAKRWTVGDYIYNNKVKGIKGYADIMILMDKYKCTYSTMADLRIVGDKLKVKKGEPQTINMAIAKDRLVVFNTILFEFKKIYTKFAFMQNLARAISSIELAKTTYPKVKAEFDFTRSIKNLYKRRLGYPPSSEMEIRNNLADANDFKRTKDLRTQQQIMSVKL